MDKIWDRNPSKSEVIGHCRDKTNDNAEPQKKKNHNKNWSCYNMDYSQQLFRVIIINT